MFLKDFLIFTIFMYIGGYIFLCLEAEEAKKVLSPQNEMKKLKGIIAGKSNLTRRYVERMFQNLEKALHENGVKEPYAWTYYESCFFVGTLLTTIGYGHITPKTSGGKLFAIFFSLLGIPLTAIVVRDLSVMITEAVMKIVSLLFKKKDNIVAAKAIQSFSLEDGKIQGKKSEDKKLGKQAEPRRDIQGKSTSIGFRIASIFVLSFLVISFLFLSAAVRCVSEGWSVEESIYFWFMTFTTVGFGDYVPYDGRQPKTMIATVVYYIGTFYLILGLALIASLIQSISYLLEGRLPKVFYKEHINNQNINETGSQKRQISTTSKTSSKANSSFRRYPRDKTINVNEISDKIEDARYTRTGSK